MGNLSAHFDQQEFACRDGCGWHEVDPQLIHALERLRKMLGRPIGIVSGRRCPPHNVAVKGALRSRHVFGDAADISRALRVSVADAKACGFKGIGVTNGFVTHVDTRNEREAQVWTY